MNIKQMARDWTKSNTGWIGDDGLELCEAIDCMKAYTAEPPLVMRRWNPRDGMGWFWQIWTMDGICSADSVTLWHPLPEPPRGEDDNKA